MLGSIAGGMPGVWQQPQTGSAVQQQSPSAALTGTAEQSAVPGGEPAARGSAGAPEAGHPFSPSSMPYQPEGYGPEELAARTRLDMPEFGQPTAEDEAKFWDKYLGKKPAEADGEDKEAPETGGEDKKTPAEEMEDAECQTCKRRKYQDGSDDPGVSFKTPTKVSPEAAASAVRGHEHEHVTRERAKAEREDRKVVSQSVTYHTGICPECGRYYVSGGTTRTVTMGKPKDDAVQASEKQNETGTD